MADYFNTFDYDAFRTLAASEDVKLSVLELHAMTFTIADKYAIPDLKAHALQRFRAEAKKGSADRDINTRLVAYIYTHAPSSGDYLRQAAMDIWTRNRHSAVMKLDRMEWESLIAAYPSFGADLILQMATKASPWW